MTPVAASPPVRSRSPHDGRRAASLASLRTSALRHLTGAEVSAARPHPDLLVLGHRRTSALRAELYDPVVCLIVQGAKETTATTRTHGFEEGQYLVVSHDVPVVSRITRASPDAPYLALILGLDRTVLSGLREHVDDDEPGGDDQGALRVGTADARLLDAFGRYLDLAADGRDAAVLGPMVVRELHYLLLTASTGVMLRRLVRHDGQAASVGRAIRSIRSDIARPVVVPELASEVGLSPSALHKHFKAITGTTPIGYLKDLRLLEARRLLVAEDTPVSQAAYAVGYGSATHFSRDYARKFGVPPSADRDLVP